MAKTADTAPGGVACLTWSRSIEFFIEHKTAKITWTSWSKLIESAIGCTPIIVISPPDRAAVSSTGTILPARFDGRPPRRFLLVWLKRPKTLP